MRARVRISSDEQLGLLTNIGVLSALIFTVLISSQTSVTLDEWYTKDYRWGLRSSAEYRLRVLQYLTTAGKDLIVIDHHGPLNISAVLSGLDEIPFTFLGKLRYQDRIFQIDRVFHATSDDVPNSWKYDNRERGFYCAEARYWMAVTLLGLTSIGSLMLYAAINMSALKEREEEAAKTKDQKLLEGIVEELKGLRSDLAKVSAWRTSSDAGPRSNAGQQVQAVGPGANETIGKHALEIKVDQTHPVKDSQPCGNGSKVEDGKADPETCVKCFNGVWEYAPSGLTISIILLSFSLGYGIHLAVWGLYDIGIARFPHYVSNEPMFDFYVGIWGWIVLAIYFGSSVQTFLNGNEISVIKLVKEYCKKRS